MMRFCNISNRPWLRRICLFTSLLGWVWNPTTFVLIQKLARRHSKVVSACISYSSPPKRRARGIVADAVPDWFFSDPGRIAGSGFLIRIRIAVMCRRGCLKNLRYVRNFTGKSNPLNNTGLGSHLGSYGRAAVCGNGPRCSRLFFKRCRPLAVTGFVCSCSCLCCARKTACAARGTAPALTVLFYRSGLSGVLVRCLRTITWRGLGRRASSTRRRGCRSVRRCVTDLQAVSRNLFCPISYLQLEGVEGTA